VKQNEGLLEISQEGLNFNGKPFYLASGDIHYFRIVPQDWDQRLKLMRSFGLTAIQTYVPWNLHEPKPGVFDFAGMKDLAAFIHVGRCKRLEGPAEACALYLFGMGMGRIAGVAP
jgi:beta-galactosidase